MKKYLLGIFAVILAVGFSAFSMKKTGTPSQYWQKLNTDGTIVTDAYYLATDRNDAISHFGCENGSIYCAAPVNAPNGTPNLAQALKID